MYTLHRDLRYMRLKLIGYWVDLTCSSKLSNYLTSERLCVDSSTTLRPPRLPRVRTRKQAPFRAIWSLVHD